MKKKILAIVLCIAMLAIAVAGGTMAYFSDTKVQTNTFTAGKVQITLDEAKVVLDETEGSKTYGDLIADGDNRVVAPENPEPYHLFPGQSVTKDPTITLVGGSEDAYLAAIITVKVPNANLEKMQEMDLCMAYRNMLDVEKLLTGDYIGSVPERTDHPLNNTNGMKVYGTAEYAVYQIADSANKTWTIYMFFEDARSENATVTLFDTIEVPAAWNNAEMAVINGMTIKVDAYAAQANGFETCYDAMVGAFGQSAGDPFNFG